MGSLPGGSISSEWVGSDGPMLQRQVLTLSPRGVALLVTGTFRSRPSPESLEVFNQFLTGFRHRPVG